MMPAAMAPPLRASAGCVAATVASPMVAAARAVRVLDVLVMAHLWFAEFVRIHSTTIGCVPCEIALSNNNYRGYEVPAFRVNGR
jgi:hypothetical protein